MIIIKAIKLCNDNQGFLSVVLSSITIFASIVAILISVNATKQQNKIALFEERYEVYQEVSIISNFIDGYYETVVKIDSSSPVSQSQFYESLWEGEIHPYTDNSMDVNSIISKQLNNVKQAEFLFTNLSVQDFKKLDTYMKNYFTMTQQLIVIPDADASLNWESVNENYQDTFLENDIKDVIDKMEKQLKLI
ncbi:hypothetical protein Q5O24_15400 [Eubacteriaceae bacterium ES3]|nr:hypothetical protein Q5O24_15400 [Eubacteriaceae bacterium ES3]